MEITGPDINVYNTRKTLWPIGQEHVDKSGRVTFKARGFFNQISETKWVMSYGADKLKMWQILSFQLNLTLNVNCPKNNRDINQGLLNEFEQKYELK